MTCIDFDTLNQLKSLEEIFILGGNMPFFPDKDCNNTAPEEDYRPLNLPYLRNLYLIDSNLIKAPNTSQMPKLEKLLLPQNAIKEIQGTPFLNNGQLTVIVFFDNDLTAAPNITHGCNNIEKLNLNNNSLTVIPENYFLGCIASKIQE